MEDSNTKNVDQTDWRAFSIALDLGLCRDKNLYKYDTGGRWRLLKKIRGFLYVDKENYEGFCPVDICSSA